LYGNELTGSIPDNFWNLTNLFNLIISDNQLSGEISENISNMVNLGKVSFSNNQFSGSIPNFNFLLGSEILQYIFLHNNQFSGEISGDICNLDFPDFLDNPFTVYNNNLCPPYPDCLTEEDIGYQDTSECIDCPDSIEGDIDGDGEVTILDIVLIVNCILSNDCDDCSDWNFDGSVDILDIILMINIILEP